MEKRVRAELESRPFEDLPDTVTYGRSNEQKLLDHALDEAIALTGSSIGYILQYDETTRRLTLSAWSRGAIKESAGARLKAVYELDQAGVWGESLRRGKPTIVNDLATPNPLETGYAKGHPLLRRFMTVPVRRSGKIVAVVGLANKTTEYHSSDVQHLTHLLASVWRIVDQHRVEAELQSKVGKLDMALHAAQMGAWYLDIPKMQLCFDAYTCRNLGLDAATFAGAEAEFFAVVHPYDRDRVAAAVRRTLESGTPYESEYRVIWPDGSVHDICARGAVACDDLGRPMRFNGMLWDITERKRMEEGNRRFQAGFEQGVVPQALTSLDGRFLQVNEALASMLGYSSAELVGKPFNDVTHPDDQAAGRQAMDSILSGQKTFRFEKRYLTRTGATIWVDVNVAAVRDAAGKPKYFIGTFFDVSDRKQAEEGLRHKTALLEAQLDSTVDGILVVDGHGKKILQNRRCIDLWGIPQDIVDQEDDEAQLQFVMKRTRYPDWFLEKVVHLYSHPEEISHDEVEFADGIVLDRYSAPVLGKDGRNYGRIWLFRDVTEQKRVEMELRESRRRLHIALDSSGMGVWHWDLESDLRGFDDQVCALLGIDRATFVGKADEFFRVVHPDDHAEIKAAHTRTISSDAPYEVEYRAVWPDGSVHHIAARGGLVRDEQGKPARIDGVLWDQTERAAFEQALRESEERFRQMVEVFPQTIFEADSSGRVLYCNEQGLHMFGASQADVEKGINLLDLVAPEDRAQVQERLQDRMQGKPGRFIEYRALRRNGETFDAMTLSAPILAQGRVAGVRGFVLDISERKQAEMELRKANQLLKNAMTVTHDLAVKAEQASAAKSEFLANMSHEIRTPLNGVLGMTGLLLDTDLSPDQKRCAEIVRSSGESLLSVINDILDFSKIEAGKLALEIVDFDLRLLLDDLAGTMALRAEEKQIEMTCAASPDVPTLLRGDPGRLRQVLANLGDNGLKFTMKGEVAVRATLVEERAQDLVLRFSVRDTGIGIPADKMGLLFQKFTQVDGSSTRRFGGTGLGLAIAKQLTELMGGTIGVQSEPGRGSEFWFTARFERSLTAETAPQRLPASLAGVRALVVDDNPTNREIVVGQIASWGMRSTEAADGPTAVELLYQALAAGDPYRVVLADMQMPGMDGEAMGRIVVDEKRFAGTKLVMLTSLGRREDAGRLIEAGFSAYLVKPVRQSELLACLIGVLDEAGSPARQQALTTAIELRQAHRITARILLAEDNITNQQVALGILRRLGHRVDGAANGKEALNALRSIPYDMVLMDVQMPEMDGLEATRAIRAAGGDVLNGEIPIIAMTAHAMQGDRGKCLASGMDDYIAKPVSPAALAALVEKWMVKLDGAGRSANASATDHPASPPRAADVVFAEAALLERSMGDRDLARVVAAGFLEDIPRQIGTLAGFVEAKDAKGVERQAHTIKGAAAAVSGEGVVKVAFVLEQAARAGDLDNAKATLAELHRQFDLLKQAMETSNLLVATSA